MRPIRPKHILIFDYKLGVSRFGNEVYLIWLIERDIDWSHQDDLVLSPSCFKGPRIQKL